MHMLTFKIDEIPKYRILDNSNQNQSNNLARTKVNFTNDKTHKS